MEKIMIFGHKNPDTDSICSALVYADLKTELGYQVHPVRLGEINKETAYVLDYLNLAAPELIQEVPEDVSGVILVDHNEFQQSVDNIRDVKILEVIDHHRISNFETNDPLYFRAEPVGCTATILYKMYQENKVEIKKEVATLMLSAIISDSLLFKSPTCTPVDVDAAKALAEIAGVNLEEYGLAMLEAGTALADKTAHELLTMDAKEFTFGDSKVIIAQVNAIDTENVYQRRAELEKAINEILTEKELDLFLLVVTDIINSNSDVLAIGKSAKNVEEAFKVKLAENRALLEGVVSRKKQIVTNLGDTFK
ncbi:MAG TPA: manganese-dependent inorganic pyrophosphatase [Pseudogracilibacillus sp.]|nr:manganese-dependent inorganic pyrophosphatase [Pseudogracilibacillus sp.]